MPEKGFFKVEEIGSFKLNPYAIFLKGRKKSFFKERELVCCLFSYSKKLGKEVTSLADGIVEGEAQFARSIFELAEDAIKEIRIAKRTKETKKIARTDQKAKAVVASDLQFLDGSSITKVAPDEGFLYALACRGLADASNIYCHENLGGNRISSVEWKRIEEIELENKQPQVHVDEHMYERLDFEEVVKDIVPLGIVYGGGSRNIIFPFPMNSVALLWAMKDEGITKIKLDNSVWEADSIAIVDNVINRAAIKVDLIYIDGELKRYGAKGSMSYNPVSAMMVLKKDGKRIVTPAPWEQAITQSYVNSKSILFRDLARHDNTYRV